MSSETSTPTRWDSGRARTVPQSPPKEYASVPDLCAMFGISKSTVYRLEAQGSIRMVRIGRKALGEVATFRAHFAALPGRKGA